MSLARGMRLGQYEINEPIGAGGMGEVYCALDLSLRRNVALKVLPEAFARDPERFARFEREARLLASLKHTGIAAIYGFGNEGAIPFLALELVSGDTLAEVLARGPLPIQEAVGIAIQISAAIENAHERGVIHRDLKPANIKITPEGKVKVLDFGLAKALSDDPDPTIDPVLNSPTITMAASRTGVIMGTAAYMSPEQARGKAVDKRTDVWAFGCLLYEMLTGNRPFPGDSVADVLSAVLRAQVDWDALPASTSVAVRRVLRRSIIADVNRRTADVRSLRLDLEDDSVDAAPAAVGPRSRSRATVYALAAVATVAIAAAALLAAVHFREGPARVVTMNFDISLPEKVSFRSYMAVSPDGEKIAFSAAAQGGQFVIWIRALGDPVLRPLAGTESGSYMFWSPDSRSIAFWAEGKLKKISLAGGLAIAICDTTQVLGGTWGRDGSIIFGTFDRGLFRVPDSGGIAQSITTPQSGVYHSQPALLPDGKHLIYLAAGTPEGNRLMGARLNGNKLEDTRAILEIETAAQYMPGPNLNDGHLVYVRENVLLTQRFDALNLSVSGEATPVAENVGSFLSRGFFTVAAGRICFYRGGSTTTNLYWFNRAGKAELTAARARPYSSIHLASDGKRVALDAQMARGASHDILTLDLERAVSARLTYDPALDTNPVWSADSSWIAFASNRKGKLDLFRKAAGGGGPDELMLKSEFDKRPFSWSPDGRRLLYTEDRPGSGSDLWLMPTEGGAPVPNAPPEPFLRSPANETQGQFSHDGKWIAYVSDESGGPQVYVQPYPATGGKWQISNNGGVQPRWGKDDKELFYIDLRRRLVAVEVTRSASIQLGPPDALFDTRMLGGASMLLFRYDVAGHDRFAVIAADPDISATSATLIVNWNGGPR